MGIRVKECQVEHRLTVVSFPADRKCKSSANNGKSSTVLAALSNYVELFESVQRFLVFCVILTQDDLSILDSLWIDRESTEVDISDLQ